MLLGSAFASLLRGAEAESSSFDLSLLDNPVVPRELFFIREHFPAPNVSSAGWKLSIRGAVAKPFELSYDEISTLPKKVLPATLECAENPVGGGLVSHAEWTGCTLPSLLERAQVTSDAKFVRFSGADGFSRTIPLAKATHADTLIAFGMNEEKLPVKHGFPLRALVPGWYGMDSVKWLREIAVLTAEDATGSYIRMTRSLLAGNRPAGPVTTMNVKSAFSRPVDGAVLTHRRFTIRGAAWAGENRIQRVAISTDGGKLWQQARFETEASPYTWVLWAYDWKIPGPGSYRLCVQAEDDKARKQPAERATDRADSYELNAIQTIQVDVR